MVNHLTAKLFIGLAALLSCLGSRGEDTVPPVTVAVAALAPIYEEVPLTGTVTARRVSMLSPQVAGLVEEIRVDDGDTVSAGDKLLTLDAVLSKIELERAAAALAEARARLQEALRQSREAEELVKKKHIPASNYEARLADVAVNRAAVRRLEAEYSRQREILGHHVIKAPFGGVIGEKRVEVGEWVETGTALFELVELDILRIEVPVPQQYFGRVSVGTAVALRFDAYPDRLFDAAVTMKIPVSDPAARTFPIRIEMENHDRQRTPGMSARVSLRLDQPDRRQALLVPRDALVRKPDGTQTLWKVREEDGVTSVAAVEVRTGRVYREAIEILDHAIAAGDRVVVKGNEILRPDQQVRIIEAQRMVF